MVSSHAVGTVYPDTQPEWRPIVATGYLICTAALAMMLQQRWINFRKARELPLVKLLVFTLLLDSFVFIFASGILVLGVGTSVSQMACSVGIWWCLLLYASSKVFIYLFLMERVYLVHSRTIQGRVTRLQSKWYRASMAFFCLWVGVFITMVIGRIAKIRADDACIIGLKLYSTIPLIAVDFSVNCFLTAGFVLPILKLNSVNGKARKLARNSSVAAVCALITSCANFIILSLEHGEQLSWVCLGSCGLDVTINAAIIWFITAIKDEKDFESTQAQSHLASKTGATINTTRRGSLAPHAVGGSGQPPSRVTFSRQNSGLSSGIIVEEEVYTEEDMGEVYEFTPRRPYGPPRPVAHVQLNLPSPTPSEEDELKLKKSVESLA